MARLLYRLVLALLLPLVLLRLWLKGRRNPAYRQRWGERLGFVPRLDGGQPRLWIHAVSVGETVATAALVQAWRARHPGWRVLITTTTPTGSDQVRRQYGHAVEHCYLPYDLPGMVRRFLERTQPTLAIVMETEIWPHLFAACERRTIPVVIANARLSARSQRGYARYPALVRPTLATLSLIACRGAEDALHFQALGAPAQRTEAVGNLKFDIAVAPEVRATGHAWRAWWGVDRPTWIAASTHPGEEAQVLAAHRAVLAQRPNALLILAPRHPERAAEVTHMARQHGLNPWRRSELSVAPHAPHAAPPSVAQVLVVDTLGELMAFYAASDVAFVGGSLVPRGGHNPLEPLALEVPVLSGPEVFNFSEVYAELTALELVQTVPDGHALASAVLRALDPPQDAAGTSATQADWWARNRGSTERLIDRVEALLQGRPA